MSHKNARTIKPLLAWIAGNFLGIAILSVMILAMPFLKSIDGIVASFLIYSSIPDALWRIVDDEATVTLAIIYTAYGTTIGLAQWVILRRHFARSSVWVLGSSVGIGLGFGLVLATDLINRSGFISGIVVVLVYGIATGSILSWLLNHHVRFHTLWSSAT